MPSRSSHLFFLAAATALLLSSCNSTSRFEVYYNAEPALGTTPPAQGQRAHVIDTQNPQEALARYQAQGYVVIGTMSLTSERITNKDVATFATEKGATLVLATSIRKGDKQKHFSVPVTRTATTYHQGSISPTYGGTSYNVSGTSTTSYTEWQQHSYKVGEYDYQYIFLAKKA